MTCINTSNLEFQALKQKSGISEFELAAICGLYLDKYGRFPYLDEIDSGSSIEYLSSKLNKYNGISTEELLDFTGTQSVEQAVVALNDQLRDLEISAVDVDGTTVIQYKQRPKVTNLEDSFIEIGTVNSRAYLSQQLARLRKLYGIDIKQTNNQELPELGLLELNGVNAFILNGDIYVNTDVASVDAPIHEMLHIVFGGLKFTNPELYQSLLELTPELGQYKDLYKNRTRNDLNEEILVSEFAKYLSGMPSKLNELPNNVLHEIEYNIMRTIDSILMGKDSVKTLSPRLVYSSTLKQLAQTVGAENMIHDFISNAQISREVANVKQSLLEEGKLIENCTL